uniref:copper metallothionein 2-like isoform X2 n=1 Tax=Styela clava TaxID=7725 RepID=UPI00193A9334|nr:copper metallothionein 2-like isoform X2 [Styela clava]
MRVLVSMLCVLFMTREGLSQLDGTCSGAGGTCTGEPNADTCNSAGTPLCVCNVNYTPGSPADACTEKTCNADSVCTPLDANSYCNTALTIDVCNCKDNFVDTSHIACERRTCSNGDRDCFINEAHSYCATTGTTGCNCGFLSDADASSGSCTPKACTATTITSDCGSGTLYCVSSQCACPVNQIPGATACVDRECAATSDCTTNGDANSECNTSTGKCACKSGYEASEAACVVTATTTAAATTTSGGISAVFSFPLLFFNLCVFKAAKWFSN